MHWGRCISGLLTKGCLAAICRQPPVPADSPAAAAPPMQRPAQRQQRGARLSRVPDHVKNPHKYTCYVLDEPLVVGGGEQGDAGADGGRAEMERVRGLIWQFWGENRGWSACLFWVYAADSAGCEVCRKECATGDRCMPCCRAGAAGSAGGRNSPQPCASRGRASSQPASIRHWHRVQAHSQEPGWQQRGRRCRAAGSGCSGCSSSGAC